MPIVNRVAAIHEEITAWRRDFHENPEIGFDVHSTAGLVAEKLKAFGCDEVVPGIGKTGIVGIIKGHTSASGKVVGGPAVSARGFLEDDSAFDEVLPLITRALEDAGAQGVGDTRQLQQVVRRTVGRWVSSTHRRRPMIIPVVIEV